MPDKKRWVRVTELGQDYWVWFWVQIVILIVAAGAMWVVIEHYL